MIESNKPDNRRKISHEHTKIEEVNEGKRKINSKEMLKTKFTSAIYNRVVNEKKIIKVATKNRMNDKHVCAQNHSPFSFFFNCEHTTKIKCAKKRRWKWNQLYQKQYFTLFVSSDFFSFFVVFASQIYISNEMASATNAWRMAVTNCNQHWCATVTCT